MRPTFLSLRLWVVFASSSQLQGTLALIPGEQRTPSENVFSMHQKPTSQSQLRGIFEMTQHLKRLDDNDIDEDTRDYYLGYMPEDDNTNWAKYFNDTPVTFSQEFTTALAVSRPIAEKVWLELCSLDEFQMANREVV